MISKENVGCKWTKLSLLSIFLMFLLFAPTMATQDQTNETMIISQIIPQESFPLEIQPGLQTPVSEKNIISAQIASREEFLSDHSLLIDDSHRSIVKTNGLSFIAPRIEAKTG